jgi:hypothetical protein
MKRRQYVIGGIILLALIVSFGIFYYIKWYAMRGIGAFPAATSPAIVVSSSSFPIIWDASSDMIVASTSGEITRDHYVRSYNLYNVRTSEEKPVIILSTSTVNIGPLQEFGDRLVFAAYENGKDTLYILALDTGVLTEKNDISSFDNFDFITPSEFIYGQPLSSPPNTPMDEYYDDIFLSENGTTTKIGHVLTGGEYGSVMSDSPDGKYIFVSNQIYNLASGTWQPVPKSCTGNRSAWLDNDVLVLRTLHDDSGAGPLCYYDLRTGATKTIGGAQAFAVVGDRIFYEPLWNTVGITSQIRVYDYDTGKDSLLVNGAMLMLPYESGSPVGRNWLIYQPVVMEEPQCMDEGCIGGVASGSPMLFNPDNGSSSPITLDGTPIL